MPSRTLLSVDILGKVLPQSTWQFYGKPRRPLFPRGAARFALTCCATLPSRNCHPQVPSVNNLVAQFVGSATGHSHKALRLYEQALEICREVGDRSGEGTTLNNLGRVYDDLGQKQKALDYYEQGLEIRREVGDRSGEGTTLWNIGAFYLGHQQDDVALACFLLAKEIYQRVQSPNADVVDRGIAHLREQLGETEFASLLAQVELRPDDIVERALREKTLADEAAFVQSCVAALQSKNTQEKMAFMQQIASLAAQAIDDEMKGLLQAIQLALLGGDLGHVGDTLTGLARHIWELIVTGMQQDAPPRRNTPDSAEE